MSDFDPKESMAFRDRGKKVSAYLQRHRASEAVEGSAETAAILGSMTEEPFHFEREEPLAIGGEKVISRAFDNRADRFVAIARPRFHQTVKEKESFLREARLASKLPHPNILPVYEMGLDPEGVPFFVMRLLTGEDLGQICRKRREGDVDYLTRYPLEALLEVFLRVCDAVIYAHSRGVLHLDIKPANIAIGRFGQTNLFDWGMATVEVGGDEEFDPDLLNTVFHTGSMKGTPGYMAPEQVHGRGEESKATDVYALGAVLYHILTGTIPVRGREAAEVLTQTREGAVVDPRDRCPEQGISVSLAAITCRALAFKPSERYPSVEALRADLSRYLHGFAPRAEKASPAKLLRMLVRRHSQLVTVMAVAGFILAGVVGVFYLRERAQNADLTAARGAALANLESLQREQELSRALSEDLWFFSTSPTAAMTTQTRVRGYGFIVDELANPASELSERQRQRLLWNKAQIELVTQRFSAARLSLTELYEMRGNRDRSLFEWVSKYADLKPDDGASLTDPQFAAFIEDAAPLRFLPELMTAGLDWHFRQQSEREPNGYLRVIIAYLNLVNDSPGWGEAVALEKRPGGYHLDLSKAPYTTFRPSLMSHGFTRNYLTPLQLVSIDLSGSSIRSSSSLRVFDGIENLILRDIDIGRVGWFFSQLRALEPTRIVLSEGVFSPQQIDRLREKHEIVLVGKN